MAEGQAKEIRISLLGTEELLAKFQVIKGFIRSPRLRSLMEQAKDTIIPLARKEVPRRSYVLHNSIGGEVRDFGTDNPKIIADARAKYAKYVEDGTRGGYQIRPKTKRWLRWANNGQGNKVATAPGVIAPAGLTEIWRKRVVHPGIKAHPYLMPAVNLVRPRLLMAISQALESEMQKG